MKQKKIPLTIRKIYSELNEKVNEQNQPLFPYSQTSLWKLLHFLNFNRVSRKSHSTSIHEKESVVQQRSRYLETVRRYREENRIFWYQDETWILANPKASVAGHKEEWCEAIPKNNIGKGGKRTIICGIGSPQLGWLPDSLLLFHGKIQLGDEEYHKQMDYPLFEKWLIKKVFPKLPDKSVIVVDRATYHLVLTSETTKPNLATKAEMIDWLLERNIPIADSTGKTWSAKEKMLEPAPLGIDTQRLKILIAENAPKPVYRLVKLIQQYNEQVPSRDWKLLILPSHHPELHPIELHWNRLKSYVVQHNQDHEIFTVERLFMEEYQRITPAHWKEAFHKVVNWEEKYWKDADVDSNHENVDDIEESEDDSDEAEPNDDLDSE